MKNQHNKKVGSSVERSDDRIKETGEVFTPMELVYQMIDQIPEEKMKNPDSTFLDNSCGSGNFLVGLLDRLTKKYGHDADHVRQNMLFGVDLMEDNINETRKRLGVTRENPHFVCADGLTYDYSFGEPTGLEAFFS
mgnify:CR=1 FL=1